MGILDLRDQKLERENAEELPAAVSRMDALPCILKFCSIFCALHLESTRLPLLHQKDSSSNWLDWTVWT